MKRIFAIALTIMVFTNVANATKNLPFYAASDENFRYMGRIDFSNKNNPTMWASATQIAFSFEGQECKIIVRDENLYGTSHNYIDIILDGRYRRIKLTEKKNEIIVGDKLSKGTHTVLVNKSTEAGIGYIIFEGAYCKKLLPAPSKHSRKIEFFGDSITSGMGSDTSTIGCHKGEWYDQTNSFYSYGALTARALFADYNITSASGIGVMHSCCNMDIVMPQVYDKISLRDNTIPWDFSKYQPDLVSICLGQNDGIQDSAKFCGAYVTLLQNLRKVYPNATFVCLSSPMADAALLAQTKKYLPAIAAATNDPKVFTFYFSGQFASGCDSHPSLSEHELIAKELTPFIKKIMNWFF